MLKKLFIIAFAALFTVNIYGQTETPKVTIQFDKDLHEYGEIEYGSDGTCKFVYTNLGDTPLILENVRTSCGCTSSGWTKDPVKPGEKGEITIKYKTNFVGKFNKTITVFSNGQPSPIILRIKGVVKPNPQTAVKQ